MQINFTYQTAADGSPSVSPEQMKTFEMAGRIWSQYLKDDVNVNIHVGTSNELPSNVVGGALPGLVQATGTIEVVNKLSIDKTSTDDDTSTNNLPVGTIVNDLTMRNPSAYLTTANGKALDLTSTSSEALDGVIIMSDLESLAWNQDGTTTNDIGWSYPGHAVSTPYSLSFLSVALHEIGHVLGFVSVIDDEDWFSQTVDPKRTEQAQQTMFTQLYGMPLRGFGTPDWTLDNGKQMPLDFFRYTAESMSTSKNDLSPQKAAYFSIDRGQTSLAEMSTSKHSGGDGYQASHWKNTDTSLGIMVPTLRLEQSNTISALDLRAFDVIGWDLADSLLGSDNTLSQAELEQTFDPNNAQAFTTLWQAASSYIDQNQSTLTGDRLNDIFQMLENSDYYEGKKRRTRESSSWQELWQEITDVFATEARFSSFDTNAEVELSGQINVLQPRENVLGSQHDDALVGNESRNALVGKQGQDILRGYGNDDLLRGGQHRDVLVGGAGSDIFVVQDKKAFDVVRDFTDGEDLLKLSGDLSFDQIGISQKNDHTLLQRDHTLLMVLRNVDADTITITDFV